MKASQWKQGSGEGQDDIEDFETYDSLNFLGDETVLEDYKDKVCHTIPGHNEVCVSKKEALKDKNIVYTISENK